VKVFVERKEPQMKQTDRPQTKPAWDGDSSEFAVLEARDKVAFRKQLPNMGILPMAEATGLIRERKGVRFADAEAHPLVHMVTIERRREQAAIPVEALTEKEKAQGSTPGPVHFGGASMPEVLNTTAQTATKDPRDCRPATRHAGPPSTSAVSRCNTVATHSKKTSARRPSRTSSATTTTA
jgi:hypothetical protein